MYIDLAKLIDHSEVGLDQKHNYGFHLDLQPRAKLIIATNSESSDKPHYHKIKKEVFICLSGLAYIHKWTGEKDYEGEFILSPGDRITIIPGRPHLIMSAISNAVVLEISYCDDNDEDTYYYG